jgi:hypothetical protein
MDPVKTVSTTALAARLSLRANDAARKAIAGVLRPAPADSLLLSSEARAMREQPAALQDIVLAHGGAPNESGDIARARKNND